LSIQISSRFLHDSLEIVVILLNPSATVYRSRCVKQIGCFGVHLRLVDWPYWPWIYDTFAFNVLYSQDFFTVSALPVFFVDCQAMHRFCCLCFRMSVPHSSSSAAMADRRVRFSPCMHTFYYVLIKPSTHLLQRQLYGT